METVSAVEIARADLGCFRSDYEGWKHNIAWHHRHKFINIMVLEVTMRDGNIASSYVICNAPVICVLEVTMRDGNQSVFISPKHSAMEICFRSDYEGWKPSFIFNFLNFTTTSCFRSDYKGWKWIGLITCERILGNYILLKLFL